MNRTLATIILTTIPLAYSCNNTSDNYNSKKTQDNNNTSQPVVNQPESQNVESLPLSSHYTTKARIVERQLFLGNTETIDVLKVSDGADTTMIEMVYRGWTKEADIYTIKNAVRIDDSIEFAKPSGYMIKDDYSNFRIIRK